MHLHEIVDKAYATAEAKGFWEDYVDNKLGVVTKLMLINSELIEAMNIDRVTDITTALGTSEAYNDFAEELADVVIRLADLAGFLGIDLDSRVQAKLAKNAGRPRKHGKRY